MAPPPHKGPRRKRSAAVSTQMTQMNITSIDDDGTQVEGSTRKKKGTKRKLHRAPPANAGSKDAPQAKLVFRDFAFGAIKTGIPGLLAEFNDIKAQTQAIGATPKIAFDSHPDKNRYKDVYCVDESRVLLKYPHGADDYIHANWVSLSDGRRYICTQGPIEKTNDDFWRMVWQEKCKSIVMLCNVIECGKKKCEQYWPEQLNLDMMFGQLRIRAIAREDFEKLITVTKIIVTDGTEAHEVEHIIWNNWPDRGVPVDVLTCFKLLTKLKRLSPTVIHCSAGIGRTGTIVGLDLAHTKLMKSEPCNLKQIVMELRAKRHGSVQMDIQYLYMHRVMIAFVVNKKLITQEEADPFIKAYEVLCKQRGFL